MMKIDIIEANIEMKGIGEEDLEVQGIEEIIGEKIIEDVNIRQKEMKVEKEDIKKMMKEESKRSIEEIEVIPMVKNIERKEKEDRKMKISQIKILSVSEDPLHLQKALLFQ